MANELEISMDSLEDFMEMDGAGFATSEGVVNTIDTEEETNDGDVIITPAMDIKTIDTSGENVSSENVAGENVDDDGTPDTTGSSDSSSSPLASFARALVEEGVLSNLDEKDEIKDFDDLKALVRREIEAKEFSDLNDTQKEYLEALRSGIPAEDFIKNKHDVSALENINDNVLKENEDLRRNLILNDFISKGYSPERAKDLTDRSFKTDSDLEDSKLAFEALKKSKQTEIQRKIEAEQVAADQRRKDEEKQLEELKKFVNDTKEIIPGMNLNENVKSEVYNSMTKVVDEKDGRPMNKLMKARAENPKEFEVKLHYLFHVTDGFKDFSKIVKTAKSKAVKEFSESLSSSTGSISSGASFGAPEDISDILEQASKFV